jgi:hypothetical protein
MMASEEQTQAGLQRFISRQGISPDYSLRVSVATL